MTLITLLGSLGTLFGASIMLPQVWKTYHTGKVRDLATSSVIIFILNCVTWIVYGILKNDPYVLLANSIGLMTNTSLLAMKILWRKNK